MYIRSILPIGALFSGSLILSNMAYLSLSVSFIQMLKVRIGSLNCCNGFDRMLIIQLVNLLLASHRPSRL
jgi:hypothetical protein